jgi:hypothetical protein
VHCGQNGFGNTDLDFRSKQKWIDHPILPTAELIETLHEA